jgi:glucose/arabinose dehydrogenase
VGLKLSPLSCTRCGAPIREEAVDDVISCGYCGQAHVLEKAAPPPAPLPVIAPSAAAHVPKVAWLVVAAVVLAVVLGAALSKRAAPSASTEQGAAPSGVSAGADGPGDATTVYTEGQSVDIYWGSSWWPGTIKRKNDNATYRITYTGWSSSWDEDVTARRLRPR